MSRDTSDFNSIKYAEEQPHGHSGMERVNIAADLVGSGNRVLDLGCWDGSIASKFVEKGNQVFGYENSKPAAELARQKGIEVTECDIESENWPDFDGEGFDVVFAGEIIEHVFDTDRFLQQVRKVLKTGGQLVITTPNIAAFGRRMMLLLGLNPHTEYTAREHDAGHIRYFTFSDLERLLRENGFEPEKVTSDVINFNASGSLSTALVPKIFPTLGRSIIIKAKKI